MDFIFPSKYFLVIINFAISKNESSSRMKFLNFDFDICFVTFELI